MEKKKVKSRFQQKIGTTEYWNEASSYGFAPLKGEIVVYQDYDADNNPLPPKHKVGIWDGKVEKTAEMLIGNLPFAAFGNLGEEDHEYLLKWNNNTKELERTDVCMNGETLWVGSATHTGGPIDIDGVLWIDGEDQVHIQHSLSVGDALYANSIAIGNEDISISTEQGIRYFDSILAKNKLQIGATDSIDNSIQLGSVVLTQNDLQRILNFINIISIGGDNPDE